MRCWFGVSLIAVSFLFLAGVVKAADPPAGKRRALLVAVSDYQKAYSTRKDVAYSSLTSYLDARRLREVLRDRYQFADSDILVLHDLKASRGGKPAQGLAATRRGIVTAFEQHLIRPARPGDHLVFLFSGHGVEIPDDNGDEAGGRDQSFVPYDYISGRTEDGARTNLRDDELGALVSQLQDRMRGSEGRVRGSVTLVFDTMDAGTDLRQQPDEEDRLEELHRQGTVVLSATATGGLAFEHDTGGGVFTYYLCKHLVATATRPGGMASQTWGELFHQIATDVRAYQPRQSPQIEGLLDRLPFTEIVPASSEGSDLYVLAVGVEDYGPLMPRMRHAETDARLVATQLVQKNAGGLGAFRRVFSRAIIGEKATFRAVESAFQEVIALARPEDTYVLFFAGRPTLVTTSLASIDWVYLHPARSRDILESSISMDQVRTWSQQIQCRKQCLLFDVRDGKAADGILRSLENSSCTRPRAAGRDFLVAATTTGPQELENSGPIAASLSRLLAAEPDARQSALHVSAAGLEAAWKPLSNGASRVRVSRRGEDFPLALIRRLRAGGSRDETRPTIRITAPDVRAAELVIADKLVELRGIATDDNGIFAVRINGEEAGGPALNGEFWATVRLKPGKNDVVVEAEDLSKNIATERFEIVRSAPGQAPPVARSRTRGDYALLVAVNDYSGWSKLSRPIEDARNLKKELEALYGFKTRLLENPTWEQLAADLESCIEGPEHWAPGSRWKKEDQLLIFFAGHGHFHTQSKEGYLILKDSRSRDEDRYRKTFFSHSILRDRIESIECDHILLMLDSCFSGTFDDRIAREVRGDPPRPPREVSRDEFIEAKLSAKSRLYLTSGGKEYVPDDSEFILGLIDTLRKRGGPDRVLTYPELWSGVEKVVPRPCGGTFGSSGYGGDFLFIAR